MVVEEKVNCNVNCNVTKRKKEEKRSGLVTFNCDCGSELNAISTGSTTVNDIIRSRPYPSEKWHVHLLADLLPRQNLAISNPTTLGLSRTVSIVSLNGGLSSPRLAMMEHLERQNPEP